MYLFIFIMVFKISAVIVIDMVYASEEEREENKAYELFKCDDISNDYNGTLYYDENVGYNCIPVEVGVK